MNLRPLGQKINAARKAKGLSLESLAGLTGIAKNSIYDLEHGRGNPTVGTLSALAKELGIPMEDLFRVPLNSKVTNPEPSSKKASPQPVEFASRLLSAYEAIEPPEKKQYISALIFDDESYLGSIEFQPMFRKRRKSL